MGCDIHLFGEKKVKPNKLKFWQKPKWVSIDKWTDNEDYPEYSQQKLSVNYDDRIYGYGRNYNLFCALAGVRSWEFLNEPDIVSEPKGLPNDCCEEIKAESDNWGSYGHSHSYVTLKELLDFDWSTYGKTCDRFLDEVIPKLKIENTAPEDVRIVFWFDN